MRVRANNRHRFSPDCRYSSPEDFAVFVPTQRYSVGAKLFDQRLGSDFPFSFPKRNALIGTSQTASVLELRVLNIRVYHSLLLFVPVSRSVVYLLDRSSFRSSVRFFHLRSEYYVPQFI